MGYYPGRCRTHQRYLQPKLEVLGCKQGLIDENVRTIIEDENGRIWLSTNAGISQWKSDEKDF